MSREQKNEMSKERILNAALEEFGQKDYVSASTNNICKNHDISKGLLFHYYKSKDELFLVCVEKCFDELSDFLQDRYVEKKTSIEESLNHYFEVRFEFFRKRPYYEQLFNTATQNPPIHLIPQIQQLRQRLKHTNEVILLGMLALAPLKEGINKEDVVQMILGFADYLQIKKIITCGAADQSVQEQLEEHHKVLTNMIQMLFYGIIKEG